MPRSSSSPRPLGAPTVLSCDVLPTVLAFHVTRGRHTSTSVLAPNRIHMLSSEYAAIDGTTVLLPPSILAALK